MKEIESRMTILFLSFLSGSCGLAYEVLYSRILSSYLGNMFYVSGSILFSFLFGLGLGSILEKKIGSKLKYLELLIGGFALFAAFLFELKGLEVATFTANLASYHPLFLSLFCIVFLLPPAILIGVCVPAFSRRAAVFYENAADSFNLVYAFYNFGAAFVILLTEFYLIRNIEMTSCLKILSLVNLSIFLVLHFGNVKASYEDFREVFSLNKQTSALFTLCFVSGTFQILLLKISYSLWGPINENFAIIISIATFCIFISSILNLKIKASFTTLLCFSAASILIPFVYLKDIVTLYSHSIYYYGETYNIEFLIKYLAIFALCLLPMISFGVALPVFKSSYPKSSIGHLLAVSSFGNALGYLATMLYLHEHFHETTLFISGALILLAFYFILAELSSYKILTLSFCSVLLLACFLVRWPYADMAMGYRVLMNPVNLKNQRSWTDVKYTEYKKYDSSVLIADFKDGGRVLSLNGYVSLRFVNSYVTIRELVSGLIPVLFTESREKALVLGLGSGVTAGATAQMYKDTEVVEINPAIFKVVREFSKENLDVMNNAKVVLQDGIIKLLSSPKKYDTIVNTITSPYYFSSNKIWTKEIFKLISDKLKPGGVYASWVDTQHGEKGFTILENTLKTAFEECVYTFLYESYFAFVCSNDKLKIQPKIEYTKSLKRVFKRFSKESEDIHSFLEKILISREFAYKDTKVKTINSLNFPALEFTFKAFPDNLKYFLRENLKKAVGLDPLTGDVLSKAERKARCAAWSVIGYYDDNYFCTQ